jgi:hypothetical protein
MQALTPGLLLKYCVPIHSQFRVVDVIEGKWVILYRIHESKRARSVPERRKYEEIVSEMQAGIVEIEAWDPFRPIELLLDDDAGGKKAEKMRRIEADKTRLQDEAYEVVTWIIERAGADIYDKTCRRLIVKAAMERFGKRREVILRWLCNFWRGGLTRDALRPDYRACGQKKNNFLTGKPGPKTNAGMRMTEEVHNLFLEHCASSMSRISTLSGMYQDFIELYFASGLDLPDEFGNRKIRTLPDHLKPSVKTFEYYYYRDFNEIERRRAKVPDAEYERDQRAVLGSTIASTFGPGSRYEVDFTVADVLLVCKWRRSQIVGKPVVGVCWDVYTGAAVGVLTTWEHASSMQLRLLMINVMSDKVEFCKRYGIDIKKEDWPMMHIPKMCVLDRGEGKGVIGDDLVRDFDFTWRNLPRMRPDLKPVVESGFAKFRHGTKFVPGWEPQILKRGQASGAPNASLNMDEFTAIIIHILLDHNRSVCLTRPLSLPTVGFAKNATPNEIWNTGIVRRSGLLRYEPNPEVIRRKAMPKATAIIKFNGLVFKGIRYIHPLLEKQQVRARRRGRSTRARISWNPDLIDEVYYQPNPRKPDILVCKATGQAEAFKGVSFVEYRQMTAHFATAPPGEFDARLNTRRAIKEISANAVKLTRAAKKADGLGPKEYEDKEKRAFRDAEAAQNRKDRAAADAPKEKPTPDNVVDVDFAKGDVVIPSEATPNETGADEIELDPEARKFLESFEEEA